MANPVLQREFITSLRTPRALVLACIFLFSLAGLVGLMWPAEGVFSLAARSSQQLFILLSLSFLSLVALCAPSFTAVAITHEKESETWDLLYDSLLRPDQIVIGKLVAGIGFVKILIVGSLPMMGACYILGGVAPIEMLKVYMIVVLAGIFFGLLGLWSSTTFRSSYRSLILCYVMILSICGVTWVPSVILGGYAESQHVIHLVRAFSPYAAIMSIISPDMFLREHPQTPSAFGLFADSPWPFVALALAGSFILFVWALIKVARPSQPKRSGDSQQLDMARTTSFPFYLIDPRKRKRMIGSILNVIAVKEMRAKAFGRATWMLRAMSVCCIVSILMAFLPLTNLDKIGIDTIVLTCISLPLSMIILISPVLTASSISSEVESGVFDMLRVTRLSAWTIVMGKLQVAWFFTILLVASTFPTFFVLAYVSQPSDKMSHIGRGVNLIRPFNFKFAEGWAELKQADTDILWQMGLAFVVMGMAMLLCTLIGMVVSCYVRRTSTATAVAYGGVMAYAVGTFIPYFLSDNLPRSLVHGVLAMNPFAAAAKAVTVETFPDLPSRLWLWHLGGVGGVCLLLLFASLWRVHSLMRPE